MPDATSAPAFATHRQELLMRGRCPACAELAPVATLLRNADCPRCGVNMSHLDPHATGALDALEARVRRQQLGVSIGAGVGVFLIGWVPVLPALVYLGAYLWLRLGVLNPLSQFLSRPRRLVTRWTGRLLLSTTLVFMLLASMLLSLLPPLAMVGNGGLVVLKVWLGTRVLTEYIHWQVRREQAGTPVSRLEWLPIGAGLLGLLLACGLFLLAVLKLAALVQGLSRLLVHA
jgi:hypothetical protein